MKWWLLLLIILTSLDTSEADDRELSVVTWNINGVQKFGRLPFEVAYLRSFDIVLLQETFSRADNELLELHGFYSHHSRAVPRQNCRNVWGLSSYFPTESFEDGYWKTLFSPIEWALVSRWQPGPASGIVVVNVYIPAHTRGFNACDVLLLKHLVEDLITLFPGDVFLVGGDFNLDPFQSSPLQTAMSK